MPTTRSRALAAALLLGCCRLASPQDRLEEKLPWGEDPPVKPALERAAALSELGRAIFFDKGTSASGKLSCATCHDAGSHFAPPNASSVQSGGGKLDQKGKRATP